MHFKAENHKELTKKAKALKMVFGEDISFRIFGGYVKAEIMVGETRSNIFEEIYVHDDQVIQIEGGLIIEKTFAVTTRYKIQSISSLSFKVNW